MHLKQHLYLQSSKKFSEKTNLMSAFTFAGITTPMKESRSLFINYQNIPVLPQFPCFDTTTTTTTTITTTTTTTTVTTTATTATTTTTLPFRRRRAIDDNHDTEARATTMRSLWTISTETKTGTLSKSVEKLNLLLDPEKEQERQSKLNESKEDFQNRFGNLDLATTYSNLFEILWYSQLPCFDIKNVTSDAPDQMSMIKQCYWKGKEIPCSSIFKTLPSDRGMCCSFNMEKAEEIFKTSTYANLVKTMHEQDLSNRYWNNTK